MRAIESKFSGSISSSATRMPKVSSTKRTSSSTPVESMMPSPSSDASSATSPLSKRKVLTTKSWIVWRVVKSSVIIRFPMSIGYSNRLHRHQRHTGLHGDDVCALVQGLCVETLHERVVPELCGQDTD